MTVREDRVGTECGLTVDMEPGETVAEGDWVVSPGTAYLVVAARASGPGAAVRGERRKLRWSLRVVRSRLADVPVDARQIQFGWYRR